MPEDEAADRLANAPRGRCWRRSRAFTGRVNLLAERRACWWSTRHGSNRLNPLDELLTVATLASYVLVSAKEMLATIKVIPFAVPARCCRWPMAMAEAGRRRRSSLHPFRPLKVGLVLTELPGLKESVMEGAVEVTRDRVEALCGTLLPHERTAARDGAASPMR